MSSSGHALRQPKILTGTKNGYVGDPRHNIGRLVLTTFVGPREKDAVPIHIDLDRTNNHVKNLHWGTLSEAVRLLTPKGEANGNANLTELKVRAIKRSLTKMSLSAAAHKHGIPLTTTWSIKHGRCWSHVE